MITFQDKVSLNTDPDIPEINKITDQNINDLKAGVNANETSLNNLKTHDTLWTGSETISSETIITLTNGNIFDYRFIIFDGGSGTHLLTPVIQNDVYLHASMGLILGSGQYATNAITAYAYEDGDKVRITAFKALTHTAGSNHGSLSNITLTGIYGVK